jgi:hypothetical protein
LQFLLEDIGLSNRILADIKKFEVTIQNKINYNQVNDKIAESRKKSHAFLVTAIKSASKDKYSL